MKIISCNAKITMKFLILVQRGSYFCYFAEEKKKLGEVEWLAIVRSYSANIYLGVDYPSSSYYSKLAPETDVFLEFRYVLFDDCTSTRKND